MTLLSVFELVIQDGCCLSVFMRRNHQNPTPTACQHPRRAAYLHRQAILVVGMVGSPPAAIDAGTAVSHFKNFWVWGGGPWWRPGSGTPERCAEARYAQP
jgi:hypothetical protein